MQKLNTINQKFHNLLVIEIDKKYKHLGLFDSKKEAINARKKAEEIYYKPLLS